MAPDLSKSEHWKDPAGFFRFGATGEWVERSTAEDPAWYDDRVAELVPHDLARLDQPRPLIGRPVTIRPCRSPSVGAWQRRNP